MPRSLLGQFVALHVAIAILGAIVLVASASALLHHTADRFQRDLLRQQGRIVAASLASGARMLPPTALANGMAVALIGPDRRLRDASGPPRPAMLAAAPLDGRAHFFRRHAVEGLVVPVAGGWILVSQDDTDPEVVTDDIVRTFLYRFALVCLPIAALVPLIGALIARRLTMRMRAVSASATGIGPHTLDRRLPVEILPSEAQPLAQATNAALDRLAAAFHAQSAFAADVAHELRTPLSVIRLHADAVPDTALRAALLGSVDRTARVIAQLLALAHLERPVEEYADAIDLHALAEAVVADRAAAILSGGRTIALEGDASVVLPRGRPEAIRLALENLIDNAARHTPAGTAIVVAAGPGPRLTVRDDGPGVPDGHLARLTERLWRGDRARAGGMGIGLSIVARIAAAHGGALTVRRGAGARGLVFTIALGTDAADEDTA